MNKLTGKRQVPSHSCALHAFLQERMNMQSGAQMTYSVHFRQPEMPGCAHQYNKNSSDSFCRSSIGNRKMRTLKALVDC